VPDDPMFFHDIVRIPTEQDMTMRRTRRAPCTDRFNVMMGCCGGAACPAADFTKKSLWQEANAAGKHTSYDV
jgi:hypothetical protein